MPLQHHFVRQTSLLRTKDQTTPRPKESPPPNIPTDEPTPKVGGFFALFTPTFRRHRPHVALYGFPAPKVGGFFALFTPTFRGYRPHVALYGFPAPKVGVDSGIFSPTFRRHRPHVALYGFPAPKVGVDSGIFSPTFRWRGGGAGWRTRGTTGRAARMGRDDTNCQAPSTSHPRQSTEASPACHRYPAHPPHVTDHPRQSTEASPACHRHPAHPPHVTDHPRQSTEASPACHRHPATPAARHRPSPAEHLTPGRKHLSPEESGARTAQENMEKCRTCHSSRYSCTPT